MRQVRTSVSKLPLGGVITSAQLQHRLENRQAPDKILGPVSRDAGLRKIRNGVYWKPKIGFYPDFTVASSYRINPTDIEK